MLRFAATTFNFNGPIQKWSNTVLFDWAACQNAIKTFVLIYLVFIALN